MRQRQPFHEADADAHTSEAARTDATDVRVKLRKSNADRGKQAAHHRHQFPGVAAAGDFETRDHLIAELQRGGAGFGRSIEREDIHRRRILCKSRSEEHTSELQSLMRISYAVFCLKKKKQNNSKTQDTNDIT